MAFIASASALWEMDTKGAQKGRLENGSFSEILFKKTYFEKKALSKIGIQKMNFDFLLVATFYEIMTTFHSKKW